MFTDVVSGVRHNGVRCDECDEDPIRGIRWKCVVCHDYDLCHRCYMSNKHKLSHEFVRIDTYLSIGYTIRLAFF